MISTCSNRLFSFPFNPSAWSRLIITPHFCLDRAHTLSYHIVAQHLGLIPSVYSPQGIMATSELSDIGLYGLAVTTCVVVTIVSRDIFLCCPCKDCASISSGHFTKCPSTHLPYACGVWIPTFGASLNQYRGEWQYQLYKLLMSFWTRHRWAGAKCSFEHMRCPWAWLLSVKHWWYVPRACRCSRMSTMCMLLYGQHRDNTLVCLIIITIHLRVNFFVTCLGISAFAGDGAELRSQHG